LIYVLTVNLMMKLINLYGISF